MVPIFQSPNARTHDVLGRSKIGLTDAKVNDLFTPCGKRLCASKHDKGRLSAKAPQGRCKFQRAHDCRTPIAQLSDLVAQAARRHRKTRATRHKAMQVQGQRISLL